MSYDTVVGFMEPFQLLHVKEGTRKGEVNELISHTKFYSLPKTQSTTFNE